MQVCLNNETPSTPARSSVVVVVEMRVSRLTRWSVKWRRERQAKRRKKRTRLKSVSRNVNPMHIAKCCLSAVRLRYLVERVTWATGWFAADSTQHRGTLLRCMKSESGDELGHNVLLLLHRRRIDWTRIWRSKFASLSSLDDEDSLNWIKNMLCCKYFDDIRSSLLLFSSSSLWPSSKLVLDFL